jgi:transcriptional regulator with XRE-family HTH domain
MNIGPRIRVLRTKAGLTQQAAADRMGWTQSSWAALERDRKSPTISTLARVAAVLQVTPADLLRPVGARLLKKPGRTE